MSFFWRVDHTYRDAGIRSQEQGYPAEDEFASRVSIDRSQRWGIANSGGIRRLSSGHDKKKDSRLLPAAVFLISNQHVSGFHNPWDDYIDYLTGTVRYWGDAKFKAGYGVSDWKGNALMESINHLILRGEFSSVPPILYFIKEKTGYVTFKGLCVLEFLEKEWFLDNGKRVVNYRCNLAILDADEVDPRWLVKLAMSKNADLDDIYVPAAWKAYQHTGRIRRLLSWHTGIRTTEQQLPDPKGLGSLLMKQLFDLSPLEFEAVICRLVESFKGLTHRITQTRHVKDGGFDMEGEFILPHPFNYTIRFKGEVKRIKGGITSKDVSRLVARLGRGEYGLYFTTSYFTQDAQKEVVMDGYPVKLISGADLYDFFYEAKVLDNNGIEPDFLRLATSLR